VVPAPSPDALTIDRSASARRQQLDDTSWVDIVDGFVRDADERFAELDASTPWQQTEVLRYDRYVPERRLSASIPSDALPLFRHTELHLSAEYRVPFSGVAVLLYRNGDDFQGFHGDRELRWLDDTRIAIVVLGVRRPFVLRARGPRSDAYERVPAGSHPTDVVLMPGHGDMIVMGGACQRDWLHCVPPADTSEARISLTWRWTSRRGRPDTNPTYYEGRQYSDRARRPGSRSRTS
jgi:alkylated DNA repair dioxygenase AlkB